MGRKWITKEEEKAIIERYSNGDSAKIISKDFDCSSSSVWNVLARNNIVAREKRPFSVKKGEKIEGTRRNKLPTKEEILERVIYDKDAGEIINRKTGKRSVMGSHGYKMCSIQRRRYKQSRIIYFLETGEQPDQIDHIDRNRGNDHISNLRAVNYSENAANQAPRKNCASQYKGVWFNKKCSKRPWMAHLTPKGERIYLGNFKTEVEAAIAYNEAAIKHFGEFAYLNIIEED